MEDERDACAGVAAEAAHEPPAGAGLEAAIRREIGRRGADPNALIEVLHQVQLREGHLAAGALHQVARQLRLPLSRVYGVVSFYHLFRLSPLPRHRLALCHGTACFVNGAEALEAVLREWFAVDPNPGRPGRARSAAGSVPGSVEREIPNGRLAQSPAESSGRKASLSMAERSAIPSVVRTPEAKPIGAGTVASRPACAAARSGDDGGPQPAGQGVPDGSEGWRLERSGCLGACGQDPVLRLADGPVLPSTAGPVVRMPLEPAASLVERLVALGLPLLPELPAPAP